jgi:DNA-binding helix-hairpin-helix protein with protein kinase domain
MCHGKASPLQRGLSCVWPKAKLSGGVQLSRFNVMLPVLRGKL